MKTLDRPAPRLLCLKGWIRDAGLLSRAENPQRKTWDFSASQLLSLKGWIRDAGLVSRAESCGENPWICLPPKCSP